MPSYQIFHSVPLTDVQQQELATAVTEIHSRIFTAMRALVNVDIVNIAGKTTYIAGHRVQTPSTIRGAIRTGPTRTRAMIEDLISELMAAWDRIVRGGETGVGDDEVRVFITGEFLAGYEGGFLIPEAGKDKQWFQETKPEIEKRAAAGNWISKVMMEDITMGNAGF